MDAFRHALSNFALTDVGFRGNPFPWTNKRAAPNTVRCLMDRVCANTLGLQAYPTPIVQHLLLVGSDHCPILLLLQATSVATGIQRGRPFGLNNFGSVRRSAR